MLASFTLSEKAYRTKFLFVIRYGANFSNPSLPRLPEYASTPAFDLN